MYDNVDDAFRELESRKYFSLAEELSAYLTALMRKGFTRRESMRLVLGMAELMHEIVIDDVTIASRLGDISEELSDPDDDGDNPDSHAG